MALVEVVSSSAKQAEQLRQDGNTYFKKERFGAAIDAYTEAITLCPNVPVYWTNRALCHRKRNDWNRVVEDCRRAIQLDHSSFKDDFLWVTEEAWFSVLFKGDAPLLIKSIWGIFRLLTGLLLLISETVSFLSSHAGCSFAFIPRQAKYSTCEMAAWALKKSFTRFLMANKLPLSVILVAHYMLGLALQQRHEYTEGVKELERAMDLGRGANPNSYMVEEIWQELAKAKYLEWEHESTKHTWELQTLKEACESALEEKHFLDTSQTEGVSDEATEANSAELELLGQVFAKAAEDNRPREVPDYLCCKITLDIFRDPVITPSGITYERAVLLDHLKQVGEFDPTTRELLYESQLIPNLAIKDAVQAFLDKHGWAYKTD
ncbi:carboxyl terminus of HSC70-interacting protein [Actinidia rufa]|uniref:E3 ubiquitin-protein ligase CHIP n=1 Tax=Actinidia rufa TaxID=165716 RepID=A0A7J0GRA8_9ERIC|nr:carboxyl terminus of HSC70-interacting protein [Actinidia rufa]